MNTPAYSENDVVPVEFDGPIWTSAGFQINGAQRVALRLLKQLDGLTIEQIKQVLQHAEILLGATTVFDCSATAFQQADEGYQHVFGESF